jgi:Arc/MetJ-type ribon-helix-helix transcriptional regulator
LLALIYIDINGIDNGLAEVSMSKSIQKGLRLAESEQNALLRVALREGRTEQDVIRASINKYIEESDERQAFLSSVEQGWMELRSGIGEDVTDSDDFFDTLKEELRDEKAAA